MTKIKNVLINEYGFAVDDRYENLYARNNLMLALIVPPHKGTDFKWMIRFYDTIPDETIQDIYKNVSEETLESLFEKYGILGVMPYDGKHAIADGIMPKPNVQLRIECMEPVGGAAALGKNGKWYWTFDMRLDIECEFTVTHWEYL